MSTEIGKVLSKIIKDRRLTLKEISKATGVPSTTLAEWQSNRTPKNPAQVKAVANFLGVSLHFLFFGEEDLKTEKNQFHRENWRSQGDQLLSFK